MTVVVDMEKKDRDPYHTTFHNLASTWVGTGNRNLAILARVLCPGFICAFNPKTVGDIFQALATQFTSKNDQDQQAMKTPNPKPYVYIYTYIEYIHPKPRPGGLCPYDPGYATSKHER